jgi:predicted PurR-regulated permease PerM
MRRAARHGHPLVARAALLALTVASSTALIVVLSYLAYHAIENYLIAPCV